MKKNYKIPVTWEAYGEMEIEADSIMQAIVIAEADYPIPSTDGTVGGSLNVDYDIAQDINDEEILDHASIAMEIENSVGDAASDVAYEMTQMDGYAAYLSYDQQKAIKEAKEEGVQDIGGWFADWLFNDPDFLEGLIGDRVHDKAKGNAYDMIKIVEAMKENAPSGLLTACDNLIKYWR